MLVNLSFIDDLTANKYLMTDYIMTALHPRVLVCSWGYQSGRSPKVVALFSATNFSSYIIELLQLRDTIQIKWNYAWILFNIATRSHLMI